MIQFFNSLTKKKEIFKPKSKTVKIYTCGPTIYDYAHIGNFRAYIFSDLLVRFLRWKKYKTYWAMNITDIDDKTIDGAQKAGIKLSDFTKKYEDAFFEDLEKLNIEKADAYPKATENIKEIQKLVHSLYTKGFAYEKDGSIYFDISKFKDYGKLSGVDLTSMKNGATVDVDQYEKESPGDFVLWKAKKENEPSWDLEIDGKNFEGRPGWHIECSAMSMKYLGETFDFHLGGIDLKFPHHENEIAQSEAATGKKFVDFWLHNEHLLVDGQKMAKSLGNFYTLRDLIQKGIDPLAFRYLCLQSHYRSKMNFTWQSLSAASNALAEIKKLGQRNSREDEDKALVESIEKAFEDDLDTPRAISILHKAGNYNLWIAFDAVLGLGLGKSTIKIPSEIDRLVTERESLRKMGDFKKADEIRKKIKEKGYEIEDTEKGPVVLT